MSLVLDSKSLADIRSDVCNTTLLWESGAALLALVLSLSRALERGWLPVFWLHLGAAALLFGTTLFRHRLPFGFRASVIIGLSYLIGIAGALISRQPSAVGFFGTASIMTAVFFGERAGIASISVSLLALAGIFVGSSLEVLSFAALPPYGSAATDWLAAGGAMVVSLIGPLVAVSRFRLSLDSERQRAEAASAAKSDFLATMSHELRTPMTGVLGVTELMLADELSPRQQERLNRIAKSSRTLLDLLNDLLDFSKIEASQLTIDAVPFSVREMIESAHNLMLPLARNKRLDLTVDYSARLKDSLIGDPLRLRQVLLNLVSNAIKFTSQGGITVRVSQSPRDDGLIGLFIAVADTGIGIPAQQMTDLFQPFTQGHQGSSRRFGGTGLGLAICKRLVDAMNGELRVMSNEGRGSTFTIAVPLAEAQPEAMEKAADAVVTSAVRQPLRILIAEDNETTRYLLNEMLTRRGHVTHCVENGTAAVVAVRTQGFDAVVMDVQMPVMGGVKAIRMIRNSPSAGAIPILVLTADVLPEKREEYLQAGADGIVDKPIDWEALAGELGRLGANGKARADTTRPTQDAPLSVVLQESSLHRLETQLRSQALLSLIVRFQEEVRAITRRISAAIAAGNLAQAKFEAHSLRSICGQFGAVELSDLTNHLEYAVQELAEAAEVTRQIVHAAEALEGALAARTTGATLH